MGEKLKVGVIGVGGIGRIHISSYQQTGEVEIVAISDASLNKVKQVQKEFGISRGYKDPEEMLEKEKLDAVSICTPNFLHASQSILSLEKGCHVLLEKPMATNTTEAREIVKKVKESGKILMMGMTWRFISHYSYLKRLAQQGEFGEIYYAHGKWLRRRGVPGLGGWFTTKKMSGGGPLVDIGVHALDCMLWIMDFPRPERVSGFAFQKFGFRAGDGGWPPPATRDEQDTKNRVFDVLM
ncbi:MAG: Gfo/Idh/MocA family oxidoreductase [Caldiserica bacterium]|nr:Gfo/Idh/MocA family oxidoreductase [Caldisericota bacterium]